MKLYPDLVAEGTPEELAAFKHIDAALTARNTRRPALVAIEGPKTAAPRPKTKRKPKLTTKQVDEVIAIALTNGGITARQMADQFHTSPETARKRLLRLRDQGKLWLTEGGVFKAKSGHGLA